MYLLYSALLALVLLAGTPYWLYEMARYGKYRLGLGQRFGHVPNSLRSTDRKTIWIHAVSVGEVLAVGQLVNRLRTEFPQYRVAVSTTTDTGQQLAASRFGQENVFYFPLDFRFAVRRYLAALRPELIVIAETEFWPNLLRLGKVSGARIAIVNARISDRSFPGYRRWRTLLERVLQNVSLFMAQTDEDSRRLIAIGAPADRVLTGGNLKFDAAQPAAAPIVDRLKLAIRADGASPVVLFGSTVSEEEELLMPAFRQVLSAYPGAVIMLAPRHPERFEEVAALLENAGLRYLRRSSWDGASLKGGVFLVDSIGELGAMYGLADLAVVGGSFVPAGGHNILEPAFHGVPIVVGPHTHNFRDIIGTFKKAGGVRVVQASSLPAALIQLLNNPSQRQALGSRARQTLISSRGATEFAIERLRALVVADSREAQRV